MEYPYSDEYMTFDKLSGHYILTEAAQVAYGTDIRARLSYNRTADPGSVIRRHLLRVSEVIYNYLHKFSADNQSQDELIACVPSLRSVIFHAMINQSEYMLMNGDWSRSADVARRPFAVDETAKEYLDTVVPELGVPITSIRGY